MYQTYRRVGQTHRGLIRQARMAAVVVALGGALAGGGQAARAQAGITTASSARRIAMPGGLLRLGEQQTAQARNWHGKFRMEQIPSKNPALAALWKSFENYKGMQTSVTLLNQVTVLPRDIPILFGDGKGEAICEYSRDKHVIVVSYEFLQVIQKVMSASGDFNAQQIPIMVNAAMHFAVIHEIGHAFIHEFGIPVTGREEDCADQFATVMLLTAKSYGADTIAGALFFGLLQKQSGPVVTGDYADVHALGKQRFFNLITWAYGADPKGMTQLIPDIAKYIPPERLSRAHDEYQQMKASWNSLTDKYVPDAKGHI